MKHFYNTNKETGEELAKSIANAKTQEEKIREIFKVKRELSASEAWAIFGKNENIPITSIRRAITNLCDRDILTITTTLKIGLYGKNEHRYKIL